MNSTALTSKAVRSASRAVNATKNYRRLRRAELRRELKTFAKSAADDEVDFMLAVLSWRCNYSDGDGFLALASAFQFVIDNFRYEWADYIRIDNRHLGSVRNYVKALNRGEDPLGIQTGVWRVWTPPANRPSTRAEVR